MAGLFGAAAPMLAGMGQVAAAKAAPSTVRPRGLFGGFNPLRFENNGMTGADRLMGIGALLADLGGGQGNVMAVQQMRQQRIEQEREAAQQEARQAAQQQLMRSLSGGGKGQAMAGGPAGQSAGLPTLREAAPALLAAQFAGVDTGDMAALLRDSGPRIRYERGFRYDELDPNSGPAFVPQLPEGVTPTLDGGRVTRVDNLPGLVESVQARVRAENDARNASDASYAGIRALETARGQGAGSAEFDLVTVQGPNGAPITMSRQDALRQGMIVGASPAQQEFEVNRARSAADREGGRNQAIRAFQTLDRRTDAVLGQIDDAIELLTQPGWATTGVAGNLLAMAPGTTARDLRAIYGTIEGNVSMDELQSIREASPTGGALGAQSDRENQLLASLRGSLDPNQSRSQQIRQLREIRSQFEQARQERKQLFGRLYDQTPDQALQGGQAPSAPRIGSVVDGYTYMGGDPANPQSWRRVQ